MVGHGLDLLADDKLTVELWRKYRDYSRQNVERLVKLSSDEFQSTMERDRHPIGGPNALRTDPVFDED